MIPSSETAERPPVPDIVNIVPVRNSTGDSDATSDVSQREPRFRASKRSHHRRGLIAGRLIMRPTTTGPDPYKGCANPIAPCRRSRRVALRSEQTKDPSRLLNDVCRFSLQDGAPVHGPHRSLFSSPGAPNHRAGGYLCCPNEADCPSVARIRYFPSDCDVSGPRGSRNKPDWRTPQSKQMRA